MPKLSVLRKQLEGDPVRDAIQSLSGSVGDRVEGMVNRLLSESNKQSNKERAESFKAIAEAFKVLNENDKVLAEQIEELNGQLGFSSGSLSDAQKKAADDLREMIDKSSRSHRELLMGVQLLVQKLPQSFPEQKEADFSILENMLVELMQKAERPPDEWRFDIERDVNNRISNVTATRL